MNSKQSSWLEHLLELRSRLIRYVLVLFVALLAMLPFANDIYALLAQPLLSNHNISSDGLIAIEVISPLLTPIKLTLTSAFFLTLPFGLYQLWRFIAPALYQHEKKMGLLILLLSTLLFYLGALFAFWVVMPLIFNFLQLTSPEGVQVMPDIQAYLSFAMQLLIAFGIAFQVPVVVFVLIWIGIASPQAIGKARPYVVLGSFAVGMLLTPPDVISQTLLAIPMWILYEFGLLLARLMKPKNALEKAHLKAQTPLKTKSEKNAKNNYSDNDNHPLL